MKKKLLKTNVFIKKKKTLLAQGAEKHPANSVEPRMIGRENRPKEKKF